MTSLTPMRSKLAKVVAMLASDKRGDRRNAWLALNSLLTGAGCTFVDLAALIEHGDGDYSEADLQQLTKQIYDTAFAEGQQFAQQQAIGNAADWPKIVAFAIQYVAELGDRDRELVKSVQLRVAIGGEPSPKQAKWMKDIYVRLGRRHGITV
jgi:hypothetical protein